MKLNLFKHLSGISLLIPTQNSECTVELCIRSFAEFPDEIIVVDNGSTDNTIDIVKSLEKSIPNLRFYNAPHLKDLYENRQYALERSRFNWIVRIDSDYVAYTDGPSNILNLRKLILDSKRSFPPIAYGITQVNLTWDFYCTGTPDVEGKDTFVQPPVSKLAGRIIQRFPGMRFQRLGRWEGVRFQKHLKHIQIYDPYWFHCNFKDDMGVFRRSERTNWRELGDFDTYPTLDSFIKANLWRKYQTNDIEEACRSFIDTRIKPYLVPYDPSRFYPYPVLIREAMKATEMDGNDEQS